MARARFYLPYQELMAQYKMTKLAENKVVQKLGNYLKLDLEYYIKNYFYLAFAQGADIAAGFLLSIALARLLSSELYGQYNYIMSLIGIAAIFTLPGMNIALTQAIARGYDRTLITGIKEKFKWSPLGSLALLCVGVYYLLGGSVLLGKSLVACSVVFPFFQNFQTYRAFLTGKKSFDKMAKYGVITQALFVSATFLVIYFTRNLMLILVTSLASQALLGGYFFILSLKSMQGQSDDPKAISFGKHMTLASLPAIIRDHYDKLFIGIFLSFPKLAVYSVALGFSTILASLVSPITTLIFPKLSQMNEQTAYAEVKKRLIYLVAGCAIITAILILACPYMITYLYSEKYLASARYAQILLFSLFIVIPATVTSKALFPSQKKTKEIYTIRLLHPISEMTAFAALVPHLGLLGAVLAKLFSRTVLTIYSLVKLLQIKC